MERYQADMNLVKDMLVEYKFEEDLTLASLDEKSGIELLETLNAVFVHLSKDHDVDVRDEGIENTAVRMYNFLNVILFQYPGSFEEFKDLLQQGDKDLLYRILTHVLSKLPELRKRAYLSRFLVPIDVPEDMFADPEVPRPSNCPCSLESDFTTSGADGLHVPSMTSADLLTCTDHGEVDAIQGAAGDVQGNAQVDGPLAWDVDAADGTEARGRAA